MPATSKIGDIIHACHLGEEKKIQKWLKSATLSDIDKLHSLPKADDDKVMGFSCTLLMFAAVNGHHRIVKLLLSHHASANIQNDQNFTALHWVSPAREICESSPITLALHCALSVVANRSLIFPLPSCPSVPCRAQAAGVGHSKIVKLLIDAGADTTLCDRDEATPLKYAVAAGQTACARLLQESADATADAAAKVKLAAASAVAGELPEAICSALTLADPKSGMMTCEATSKVHAWLDSGGHADATCMIPEVEGQQITVLMAAAARGDSCLVHMLIANNATIDLRGSTDTTAIALAASASPPLLLPAPPALSRLRQSALAVSLIGLPVPAWLPAQRTTNHIQFSSSSTPGASRNGMQ